ncbi:Ku protein [Beijerinckia indica]|uniref:Non-homologous end joining protein Ku n=1 Tax=Beijerinckia indica subsp. indica (strain ATCC 9039 / DSM 1715 / NCIMB 8712) TaxID=395963 RepID=B2IE10_BEII9|nr:Ku protein [Beijerinckia indica]ACB94034.1 Ku protein [Beijerinckia indica subsp. indica ATCC 9039]
MTPRANWKGLLKIAEVTCQVALYTAVSTSERIAFHTLNRATGHRVQRRFIDSETGSPVEKADQVKGYETGSRDYVILEPEEIAEAIPETDKILSVSAFIRCDDIDDIYFDKPYYLAPADPHSEESYAVIHEGLRTKNVAALAQTVLFRRLRTVLIRVQGRGMIATTLNFDYEVLPAGKAFEDIPTLKVEGEMVELAEHIIQKKIGHFNPAEFDDRYEAGLAELVKAKLEGKEIQAPRKPQRGKVIDLMTALRDSAALVAKKAASSSSGKSKATAPKEKATPRRRKAS